MPKTNKAKKAAQKPDVEIDIKRFVTDRDFFIEIINALRLALKLLPKEDTKDPLGGVIYWPELHDNSNASLTLVKLILPMLNNKEQNLWLKMSTKDAYVIEYGCEEGDNIIFSSFNGVQYPKNDGALNKIVRKLNRGILTQSVYGLLNKNKEDFLWVGIAIVFCESARFDSVRNIMMGKVIDATSITECQAHIFTWMIRNWSNLINGKDVPRDIIDLARKLASNLDQLDQIESQTERFGSISQGF